MDKRVTRHDHSPQFENKSSTHSSVPVKCSSEQYNLGVYETVDLCGFVIVEGWRYGDGSPFCDAPVVPGRAYCERHWELCRAAETGGEGEAVEPGGPPAELTHLRPVELPEPGESLAELELPAGASDGEV